LDNGEVAMRWIGHWGSRSNDRAVVNARAATTALSRLRVEREEVELYLRQRYGAETTAPAADVRGLAASR
jgi:hypothetical protein